MESIINLCLNTLSKAVGDISLFLANVSAETMSWMGIYESDMPVALRPIDEEAE